MEQISIIGWLGHLAREFDVAELRDLDELAWEGVAKGLLDLARDAAHGIDRPAAPLTTFLAGYVAGSRVAGLPADEGSGGPTAYATIEQATGEASAIVARQVGMIDS